MIIKRKAEKSLTTTEVKEHPSDRISIQISKQIKQVKTKFDDEAIMMEIVTPFGPRTFWPNPNVLNTIIDLFGEDTDKWINQYLSLTVKVEKGRNGQSYEKLVIDEDWISNDLLDSGNTITPRIERVVSNRRKNKGNNNVPTVEEIDQARIEKEAIEKYKQEKELQRKADLATQLEG